MIHHSNPTCDTCGERHSDGHIGECNEALVEQRDSLRADNERLTRELEKAKHRLGKKADAIMLHRASRNRWKARAETAERERNEAREALEKRGKTIVHLRALCARAYRADAKPDWEEGECLNEVLSDLAWEGIDVPKQEAEARAAMERAADEKGG